MSRDRRVVFDTSTLVSAALRVRSVPRQALLNAIEAWKLCTSTEALEELETVLRRPKFDRYLDEEMRHDFLILVRREAVVVGVANARLTALMPSCRDPKDNKFLALAFAAKADALVSSDKDLLVLHPWHGIRIVTPAEFVAQA
jgi:putative PIN family toxin of toxin-antitoxin system